MSQSRPLILASASPRRRELLKKAGISFHVYSTNVEELDEDSSLHLTPAEFTWCNALRKAFAAAKKFPGDLILAADTAVILGSRRLGKPKNLKQAALFLSQLSGKTHSVFTSVIVISPRQPLRGLTEITQVRFKRLSSGDIKQYLDSTFVLDKAGAYAFQENGGMVIANVIGLESNVIGLPIERLSKLLPKEYFTAHKQPS